MQTADLKVIAVVHVVAAPMVAALTAVAVHCSTRGSAQPELDSRPHRHARKPRALRMSPWLAFTHPQLPPSAVPCRCVYQYD